MFLRLCFWSIVGIVSYFVGSQLLCLSNSTGKLFTRVPNELQIEIVLKTRVLKYTNTLYKEKVDTYTSEVSCFTYTRDITYSRMSMIYDRKLCYFSNHCFQSNTRTKMYVVYVV